MIEKVTSLNFGVRIAYLRFPLLEYTFTPENLQNEGLEDDFPQRLVIFHLPAVSFSAGSSPGI